MRRIEVEALPDEPLAAAETFHRHWLAPVEDVLRKGEDMLIVVAAADRAHREWRQAVVAGLARKHAPRRVNMVAGAGSGVDATETYLARAPGITGQYLEC
ncbi:MAG: Rossmann fold domain-containing protein [Erythrobacter sp.]|jgi:hypothetical protein